MMIKEEAIKAGVTDSFDFWLSQHEISFPVLLEAAIREAMSEWLEEHSAEVLRLVAAGLQGEGTVSGEGGYQPGTGSIILSAPKVTPG